ncbi:MAG: OmpA family protein [Longimonas sp.]|uniref:OmpA family protein n=1 Tax=Longimonas sp. TaxID=2039626 RepID=UPI00334F1B4B
MQRTLRNTLIALTGLLCILGGGSVHAQAVDAEGKAYPDGHGGTVFFPMGDVSFADEVVGYTVGTPDGGSFSERPEALLGPPEFETAGASSVFTLGCGGHIVLAFTENTLIDVPGADLHVFEVGRDIEAIGVAVSEDGETWIRVGMVAGGNAEVDVAPFTPAGAQYDYVKLVDLEEVCDGRTPGADVDAVGAIGTATRVRIDSAVLFATDEYILRPEASRAIDAEMSSIPNPNAVQIEVAGHTDNVGSAAYNERLAQRRADAVATYLVEQGGLDAEAVTTNAYGESRPVASNETDEGRSQNRRVELTVRSRQAHAEQGTPVSRRVLGIWDTPGYGILELQQDLDNQGVNGTYTVRGGTLRGQFTTDTVFEGVWTQETGEHRCATERHDSAYWGNVRLEFDGPDHNEFTGTYGHCEAPPDHAGWDGHRMM